MENETETVEEVKDEKIEEVVEEVEEKKDRPDENFRAELERKTQEIANLRNKIDESTKLYNPNDLRTWPDQQLQALRAAPDAKYEFKLQAEDILMDRKVERRMGQERERQERQSFETKRIEEFPETIDPASPFSIRMQKIARELRLDNSPSGLYAAAKLASVDMKKPKGPTKSMEKERVAAIKSSKTSGDVAGRGAQSGKVGYDDLLKKADRSDEAFKAALKAKVGGMGLRLPSSGL